MEEKLREYKKEYEKITAPQELSEMILLEVEKDKNRNKQRNLQSYKKIGLTAAAFLVVFTGMVNVSPKMAMAMYQVPLLGDFARVVTFREYQFADEKLDTLVKVPKIEGTGNEELEKRINEEINKKVEEVMAEAEQRAQQYHEDLQKIEGMEGETRQFDVRVDYEKKYSDGKILSFVLYQLINGPSAEPINYYYNLNLETGEELKLSDVLGENYQQIANESIYQQIEERMAADENQIFFGKNQEDIELGILGFTGVKEDQTFYINEKGNAVITFPKYEIAPGYMGMPEFEILRQ